jgi:putative tryptophan/tyrosine transport system substrate-binding protein
MLNMRRREFISLLGGAAAAWPLAARAQQNAVPVIGLLSIGLSATWVAPLAAFRQGLAETGYIEGRNIAIEYRWAEGQFERMPMMAADLVRRKVAVIFANGPPSVLAAKAQTTSIPIIFSMGEDPVKEGIVASFNRPGGNVTGFTWFTNLLFGKRLGLLREIAPKAAGFALLVNPNNPNAEPDSKDAQAAADALGLELRVLTARNGAELEPAFAAMVQQRLGGVLVGVDSFGVLPEQLVALPARHAIPAIYQWRDYPAAGGLMSYGASREESWHQAGIYVGRILKGEKAADLPVVQSTKFEFIINLKTAKTLGLDFPPGVLAIADEVIE